MQMHSNFKAIAKQLQSSFKANTKAILQRFHSNSIAIAKRLYSGCTAIENFKAITKDYIVNVKRFRNDFEAISLNLTHSLSLFVSLPIFLSFNSISCFISLPFSLFFALG
jgi:pyrimidine operon attenuation protein/uracil phosphoribosyltransferase